MVAAQRLRRHLFLSLLVVSLFTSTVSNGQSRLAQASMYPLGGAVLSSFTSDFNGDGRSDVLLYVVPNNDVRYNVLGRDAGAGER